MGHFQTLKISWGRQARAALGAVLVGICYASLPAQDAAVPQPMAKTGRIVVLGDSITAGFGLAPDEAYPALLQGKVTAQHLPYQVINAGLSGDTTAGGLRRIDWVIGAGADVLIVALGGNDGLRGIPPEQTYQNLRGIIEHARAKSPKISIIVAGMEMPPNMGREFVEAFHSVFPRIAKDEHAEHVPFLLTGVGGVADLNQADMIHPNIEGQKRVAENVWSVLQKVLKERAQH